jgi:GDP/UDP-N,N'-diacetylbacillosamine 2-epimerase (hydrolysing)
MRQVSYVSGSRADFGLMRSTLLRLHDLPGVELSLCVTGMHLLSECGMTVREIEGAGLPIAARVEVALDGSGRAMAIATGQQIEGFVRAYLARRPDIVLLLGDRGEMLAGALAALHLGITSVHIHGGERSGTVDEPVRHAISKLAGWHCVATEGSRQRLLRMGEADAQIRVTGAPGLDGIVAAASIERVALFERHTLDPARRTALFLFHPVGDGDDAAAQQTGALLDACAACALQVVAIMPNADAGALGVRHALDAARGRPGLRLVTHLARSEFLSWMRQADVLVGNSSSGIIEAASVGLPVVNAGPRQNLRERNRNVVDVECRADLVAAAIGQALVQGRHDGSNVYGDGHAGERIAALLTSLPLNPDSRGKVNAY